MSVSAFFSKVKAKPSPIDRNDGFTLIELLVVIIVIGILATILIVGGNSYFHHAADTAVQADLDQASRKLDAYKLKNGLYAAAALNGYAPDNVTIATQSLATQSYCLKATSTKYSDVVYYVDNKGTISKTSC